MIRMTAVPRNFVQCSVHRQQLLQTLQASCCMHHMLNGVMVLAQVVCAPASDAANEAPARGHRLYSDAM